jgi:hypothetical protein
MIPPGYLKTVKSDSNQLQDPALAALYDDLKLATRGPLFSKERWRAIWRLNRGIPQSKIDWQNYRLPVPQRRTYEQIATPQPDSRPWDAPENVIMAIDSGLRVALPQGLPYGGLSLRVCSRCWYVVVFRKEEKIIHAFVLNGRGDGGEMMRKCIRLPAELQAIQPEEMLIYPMTDWRLCSISDLQFGTGCTEAN